MKDFSNNVSKSISRVIEDSLLRKATDDEVLDLLSGITERRNRANASPVLESGFMSRPEGDERARLGTYTGRNKILSDLIDQTGGLDDEAILSLLSFAIREFGTVSDRVSSLANDHRQIITPLNLRGDTGVSVQAAIDNIRRLKLNQYYDEDSLDLFIDGLKAGIDKYGDEADQRIGEIIYDTVGAIEDLHGFSAPDEKDDAIDDEPVKIEIDDASHTVVPSPEMSPSDRIDHIRSRVSEGIKERLSQLSSPRDESFSDTGGEHEVDQGSFKFDPLTALELKLLGYDESGNYHSEGLETIPERVTEGQQKQRDMDEETSSRFKRHLDVIDAAERMKDKDSVTIREVFDESGVPPSLISPVFSEKYFRNLDSEMSGNKALKKVRRYSLDQASKYNPKYGIDDESKDARHQVERLAGMLEAGETDNRYSDKPIRHIGLGKGYDLKDLYWKILKDIRQRRSDTKIKEPSTDLSSDDDGRPALLILDEELRNKYNLGGKVPLDRAGGDKIVEDYFDAIRAGENPRRRINEAAHEYLKNNYGTADTKDITKAFLELIDTDS